jgi:hypothetical protein
MIGAPDDAQGVATEFDHGGNLLEVVSGEGDVGGFDGDVGSGQAHGDGHVGQRPGWASLMPPPTVATVPGQQGARRDDPVATPDSGQEPGQRSQQCPVRPAGTGCGDLTAQHRHLIRWSWCSPPRSAPSPPGRSPVSRSPSGSLTCPSRRRPRSGRPRSAV